MMDFGTDSYMTPLTSIAPGFQSIDWSKKTGVVFPAEMLIDYVRVYQPHGKKQRISCDPPDHPTADYIQRNLELYTNPNITGK